MKRIPVCLAALCLVCRVIYGGPPEPIESGPAPAPATFTWTGFYLGASGGYTRGQVDQQLDLGGAFNQIPAFVTNAIESRGSEGFDYDGAMLGGFVGFNYQITHVVLGLEAGASYLWSRDSTTTGTFLLGQGVPPLLLSDSFKTHYLVTVAPRIGWAIGRFLPYATGGLAVGDEDWNQTLRNQAQPPAHLGGHVSEAKAGWTVGGGLEYALTNHWEARVQYQYVDLGNTGFDSQVNNSPDFLSRHNVGFTEHNATFALLYKF